MTPERAHFITSTIVAWLPVFTSPACADILVQSFAYCQQHKELRLHACARPSANQPAMSPHTGAAQKIVGTVGHLSDDVLDGLKNSGKFDVALAGITKLVDADIVDLAA